MRQAVSIGRYHRDGFRLQHQQRAVQRVARLFVADGKDRLADQRAEGRRGNLHRARGGEVWHAGKVRARHANHLGIAAAGANVDPVVLQQLDGDVAIAQQFHVVVEFARGDGTGAIFLDPGLTTGAQAQVQIRGGDSQLAVGGLKEKIGQNGDGRLAFDDALGRCEFLQQVGFTDRDLHGGSLHSSCLRHDIPKNLSLAITCTYIKTKGDETSRKTLSGENP